MTRRHTAVFSGVLLMAFGAWLAGQPVDSGERDAVRAVVKAAAAGEIAPATAEPEAARRWLAANTESVRGVVAGPLKDLPWGYSTFRPAEGGQAGKLYLHVFDWHAGSKVIAYGLGGDVKRAYLLADANKTLDTSKTERSVVVSLPRQPPDAVDSVVVLEIEGEPKVVSLAVDPSPDGTILLHSRDSIIHGKTVRYEPEPNKNTVGYWTNPTDWVEWQFNVPTAGKYSVEILQGCGRGSGGSTVDFAVGEQTLPVTVQDTGGFQNFVARDIGKFDFAKPGKYTLTVKPTKKPGQAVMDLRQVTLKPANKANAGG